MKLKYHWFDSQEDKVRVYYTPRKTPTHKELQPSSLIFLNKTLLKLKLIITYLNCSKLLGWPSWEMFKVIPGQGDIVQHFQAMKKIILKIKRKMLAADISNP